MTHHDTHQVQRGELATVWESDLWQTDSFGTIRHYLTDPAAGTAAAGSVAFSSELSFRTFAVSDGRWAFARVPRWDHPDPQAR